MRGLLKVPVSPIAPFVLCHKFICAGNPVVGFTKKEVGIAIYRVQVKKTACKELTLMLQDNNLDSRSLVCFLIHNYYFISVLRPW